MKHKGSKIQSIRWSEESRVLTIETRRAVYRYTALDGGYGTAITYGLWSKNGKLLNASMQVHLQHLKWLAEKNGGTYHAPTRLPWFDRLIVECMMMKG